MRVTLILSADAALAFRRHADALAEAELRGGATDRQLDEIRSYAAEAVHALSRSNPDVLPMVRTLRDVAERKAGR